MDQETRNYIIVRVKSNSSAATGGCVLWTATKNKAGYGIISVTLERGSGNRTMMSAHRALYIATTGKVLPRNIFVLHKCDNPACVNFDHLFEGTAQDNMLDCISKGRKAKKHHQHKRQRVFTDEQIKAIRDEPGKLSHIAEKFGTSPGYVSKLKNGKAKNLVV